MVLRGTEPNLVPMLMPSREVRLFDSSAAGTFGRRAGVMQNRARTMGGANKWLLNPSRRVVNSLKRRTTEHPNGGGRGFKWNPSFRLDWKWHPCINNKTTYWLSGYVLRNRHYVKSSSTADLKSKTYSWASRDPIPK
jgi:ribosomal protein L2